ncbi:MAG TPA: VOC family protein [Mycobacteriales bacterium]|nr:VOC family protein [Mycobacteriales bacterium]
MSSTLGQYCINVTDLESSVAFFEGLGIPCDSRTEIEQAFEAIIAHPSHGSRLQLAQQRQTPWSRGNALWKIYINTRDIAATFARAVELGARVESEPEQLDRWPVTVGFVRGPDDMLIEFVERHPWPDTDPLDAPWLGQYCVNVSDLDATIAFYELLGLTCTSRTEIPQAFEAIIEDATTGRKLQLAQQKDQDAPIDLGMVWKLYVYTDDCAALYRTAVDAGFPSVMEPTPLDRWPVTVAFVADPDGYQIELVERHQS